MKVKITHPIDELQAGLVYDVPDKKAHEYISDGVAITVDDERLSDVTALGDKTPLYIETKKKVKHGNG